MAVQERNLFNSIVSGAIPVGAIFGSTLGGMLAEKGRRKAIIIICLMQITGSLFWVVFDFTWLMIGRLIQGAVIGWFTVVTPLYINEVSPKSISGSLGMANQLMVVIGGITAKLLGLFVPLRGDEDVFTSHNWKVVFGFPGAVAFAQLVLMVFVFQYDSPTYYSMHRDERNYSAICSKLYQISDDEASTIFQSCSWECSGTKDITWADQFSPRYRYALIIGCILGLFQQATGANWVSFYSNEMFMQGLTGDEAEMSARVGTLFVDVVSILGVFLASYLLRNYGRKTLLMLGVGIIWIIFWGLFLASKFGISILIKILIFWFVFSFNISIGGLLWFYAAEILTPKGISIVAQINYFGAIIFGSTVNIFFELLGVPMVYFSFAVIQVISFSFISVFVKETKGLSRAQWERLYKNEYQEIESEIELNR